jgi:hypothetical protein
MKRIILRTKQEGGLKWGADFNAILGMTIVVTLCVYYPCQDAGVQRPRFAEGTFGQQRVQIDFEELRPSLLKRKGLEIAAE